MPDLTPSELLDTLYAMQREHIAAMNDMVEDKPAVTNGRSDGKRVRYVRHEEAVKTIAAILDLLAIDR